MLKLIFHRVAIGKGHQPPLGGCVLKLKGTSAYSKTLDQPPLGGCVLKQVGTLNNIY